MPAQSVSQKDPRGETAERSLADRVHEIAFDRAATSDAMVLETAQRLLEWVLERPDAWSWSAAGRELETGLAEWHAQQGWRGPAAIWFDSLRAAWHQGSASHPNEAREYLSEELGLWLCSRVADGDVSVADKPWNGAPLGSGRRLASRSALAAHAAPRLEKHELILLNAHSNTVATALEAAWRAGKHPEVLVCEGLPTLEGRRMARRLSRAGLAVSVCYDSALHAALDRADRVWLGTEAIGANAFLARVGTRGLLEEAARRDVAVELLATSDKLMPAGELSRPSWPERETWLLWDEAPENVRLETQCYEITPLDLVGDVITECGTESPARLSVRALRAVRPAPCGVIEPPAPFATQRRPAASERAHT